MNIQIAMIDLDTGEPIYDTVMKSAELSGIDVPEFWNKIGAPMLNALAVHKPRRPPLAGVNDDPLALPDDPMMGGGVDLMGS